jgi:hypothetical protein
MEYRLHVRAGRQPNVRAGQANRGCETCRGGISGCRGVAIGCR